MDGNPHTPSDLEAAALSLVDLEEAIERAAEQYDAARRSFSDLTPLRTSVTSSLKNRWAPALERLLSVSKIAVGCSGGPDSLGLTLLLQEWAAKRDITLTPMIVDHGLRAGSREEAAECAAKLESFGLKPVILSDQGQELPSRATSHSNLQAFARDLRFRLMQTWMREAGVQDLFLAHHQEDQAETVLLRMARGSGVTGLSAMRPVTALFDPLGPSQSLWRPLLSIPKQRLGAVLLQKMVNPAFDPSNTNRKFARVRLREAMPVLSREGLGAETLSVTAASLARADTALQHACLTHLAEWAQLSPLGFARLSLEFLTLPDELRLRTLSLLLRALTGAIYPPRLTLLSNALKAIETGRATSGITVTGAKLKVNRASNILTLCRETAAIKDTCVFTGLPVVWDGRFVVSASGSGPGSGPGSKFEHETEIGRDLHIRPLGRYGVAQARNLGFKEILSAIPGAARASLPGIWQANDLVSLPDFSGLKTLDSQGFSQVLSPNLPPGLPQGVAGKARFFGWKRVLGEAV